MKSWGDFFRCRTPRTASSIPWFTRYSASYRCAFSMSNRPFGGELAASSEVDRSVGTHVCESVKLTTRTAMDLRRGALDASGWEELTRNDMMVPRLRPVGEPIIFYCSHRCLPE